MKCDSSHSDYSLMYSNSTVSDSSEVCNANKLGVTEAVHVNKVYVKYNLERHPF